MKNQRMAQELTKIAKDLMAGSFRKVKLDKDEKELIKNLSEIVIGGKKYEFMQLLHQFDGNAFAIDHKGREVGRASLARGGFIENIRIDSSYRRKGLATKLYDYIEMIEKIKIKPSPIKISPEAREFWKNRKK